MRSGRDGKSLYGVFAAALLWLGTSAQHSIAQSIPAGTYVGTYIGGDYGTLTVTVDAHAGATCDFYSTPMQQHFIIPGSAAPSLICQNAVPSDYLWTVIGPFSYASVMTGTWQFLHNGQIARGTFSMTPAGASGGPPHLGGYMSGNWFDPSPNQSGHGFQLEFTDQANTVVAIWFVYAPDGKSQNWIYAQGTYDATKNSVTLTAVTLTGAMFPPHFDSHQVQQAPWGTLTFTFSDCNTGTASWNSTVAGYGSGSIPISRLTHIAGTVCPQ
jgi:hypothetical protein